MAVSDYNPFEKKKSKLSLLGQIRTDKKTTGDKSGGNEKDLIKCPTCESITTRHNLTVGFFVCPACNFHYPISARSRIRMLVDKGTFKAIKLPKVTEDPLDFPGYAEKIEQNRLATKMDDAVTYGTAKIRGREVVLAVLDSRFMMGSMGNAVGETVTCATELAGKEKLPLIIFSASGGARMQEGIFSLMQMAKTSAAIAKFSDEGGFFISYLTHPTTGGVSASFATLGDVTIAEPGVLIGFAGPRVIEQTIREKLPEGFQRTEYLQQHGFIDAIVSRPEMRKKLSTLIKLHKKR